MIAVAVLLALQADDLNVFKPEEQPRKMLYAYLQAECGKQFDARRKAVAELKTPEDVKKRQDALRSKFVEALGGFPEKTPLNPKVVGTVRGDGFRVEKVIYESRPDHHVTANFYVPEGKGPFPGVLVPCGHSDNGKASEAYQRVCILMAKNGLAVLCYDPIGQGERMQLLNADGKPAIKGNTTEHTHSGIGALLVGWSCASYRIWDGIRSIDYLAGRPEVDPKRLGCTGNSGGGTLTSYLMALDDRIAAAAPSCYVTTLERLFATIGPQDAEQNITGQVAFGMEQTDYVTMRAPRPTLMCTATQDFFDIQGCWTTFREAKRIYGMLGHAERMDLIEYNDKHGFSKPRREAAMRWMRRWLLGVDDAPVEGDFPVFKDAELQCTQTGQVLADLKGKSVFDLNRDRENQLREIRASRSSAEVLAQVREVVGRVAPATTHDTVTNIKWNGFGGALGSTITEPGIRLPSLLVSPEPARNPALVLLLAGDGKSRAAAPGGPVERWAEQGHFVLAMDLRGYGELAPEAKAPPFGADWKEAFLGIHLNRSLVGQRAADILSFVKGLGPNALKPGGILVGTDGAVPAVLHAAVLEERFKEIVLENGLVSWASVVRTPVSQGQLANVVPGALMHYDLPDLAALLVPRKLTIKAPRDAAGKPVTQGELEAAYARVREAYKAAGAEQNLLLQAAP